MLALPCWQYASPHWLSTTLWLGVAAVLLSERLPRLEPACDPRCAGVLAGAAVCVQQQRGVYVAAWAAGGGASCSCSIALPGRAVRRAARELGWLAAGTILVIGLDVGQAMWASSPRLVGLRDLHLRVRELRPGARDAPSLGRPCVSLGAANLALAPALGTTLPRHRGGRAGTRDAAGVRPPRARPPLPAAARRRCRALDPVPSRSHQGRVRHGLPH